MYKRVYFIGLMLISSISVNAQIIYTNIDPDSIADYSTNTLNDTVWIDINNDNVNDVYFAAGISLVLNENLQGVIMHVENNNQVAADVFTDVISGFPVSFNQALVYGPGIEINSGLTYKGNSVLGSADGLALYLNSTFITAGNATTNNIDFYIGVKLDINGNSHYAWIKANIDSSVPKIIIKSMAYNSQPDLPVNAGKTNGINNNEISKLRLYPNPFTNELILKNISSASNIQIFNISGQLVNPVEFNSQSSSINTSHWKKGMYFIKVKNSDFEYVYKVVKH